MTEKKSKQDGFTIAGISVKTENNPFKLMRDIPPLWKRFSAEDIPGSLNGRIGEEVYVAYTEFEGDHTKPYTYVLGCKVEPDAEQTLEGVKTVKVQPGTFQQFTATGSMPQALGSKWMEIWKMPLARKYQADYEIHDTSHAADGTSSVEIFIEIEE